MAAIRRISLALSLSCVAAGTAAAQQLSYDGFGNGPLPNLQGSNGGTGWSSNWADGGYDVTTSVSTVGLSYPGLALTPGAAVTGPDGGVYPISSYVRSFGPLPPGTTKVYVSFLLREDVSASGWGGLSFGTYPFAMAVGAPPGAYLYGLETSEGLGDFSNLPLITGDTTLVVVKISKNTPGSGITYSMYLNPTIGSPEPGFPQALFSVGPVNAIPTALSLRNGGGFTTDEIRVGMTWSDVLPAPPQCVGDLNHNGTVDGADLGILLGNWGLPGGDPNGDGTTNGADLGLMLSVWGPCP